MSVVVSTNGTPTHIYVGTTCVPLDENGMSDPIRMALAMLRLEGRQIVSDTMADFRRSLGLRSFNTRAWWM